MVPDLRIEDHSGLSLKLKGHDSVKGTCGSLALEYAIKCF
jgi:hypothetical protein